MEVGVSLEQLLCFTFYGETVKFTALLQGPYPPSFQVWIHQRKLPALSVTAGAKEQVAPLQTADDSYHLLWTVVSEPSSLTLLTQR